MTPTQLPLTPTGARSTGLELKEQGIESLERHRWVDDARLAAEGMLCEDMAVDTYTGLPDSALSRLTSDDIHDVMGPPPHDNCYGAIFHDKRFKATGERVRSTRPEAHGREIRVWRLA
ncbi:hypothetical protein LCGC14_0382640 [marine sediment metagenome]|uniref:Uncharacterized protein n=1 Tax=marine sediment metagenome TaxID=412755 RepID=A0A0F9T1V8_9ZZZZ